MELKLRNWGQYNMNKILVDLQHLKDYVLDNCYIDDYDGDDPEGKPIIRKVFFEPSEDTIKSLLDRIDDIITLVKEENND